MDPPEKDALKADSAAGPDISARCQKKTADILSPPHSVVFRSLDEGVVPDDLCKGKISPFSNKDQRRRLVITVRYPLLASSVV